MLAVGGGVILLIAVMTGWAVLQSRADAYRTAEVATTNLSKILANQFFDTIDLVDKSLLTIGDEFARQMASGREDEAAINAFLLKHDARYPNLTGFRIYGPDGRLRYAVSNVASRGGDNSQAEDFKLLRDNPDAGLVVSEPILGPTSKQWLIRLGRRLANPDGSFAGVIWQGIPVKNLLDGYTALDLGAGGTVALYHTSFRMAARYPATPGPDDPTGKVMISAPLRQIIASGVPETQYSYDSVVDGVRRTAHVRRIGHYPYVILVGMSEADYLSQWRGNSLRFALFGGVMSLMVAIGMLIIHRRITDGTKAAEALAEKEAKLRGLFELSPLGIALNRLDGSFVEFNSAYLKITGYEGQELLSLDYWRLTPPHYREQEAAQLEALNTTGRYGPYEKDYIRKDGSTVPVRLLGMIVHGKDGTPFIWSLVEDISERRAGEKAMRDKTELLLQSNTDLEQFAYVASHDLQTPVRNVVSYAQLLERRYKGRLDPDADEFIGFIVASSLQMSQLIADLLEYSRVARQSGSLSPIAAGDAINAALLNLKLEVQEAEAEIQIGPMPVVMAESSHLISLFQNLIGNALKYKHPARPIEIGITAVAQGPDLWRFAVADNGIGIEADYFEKIFEIFQRLRPDSGREGTGIGLTLCRRIVHRFGGIIWVESQPEQGSTFLFTLRGAEPETAP
ncbi:Phytochrome two-component sensor histidine kinase Cyanobacterial phytochrome B [Paramagnetospirillum magnetotacticum MS-1]|uniref:histidine kinase n=1 Tax=Paramagnetospirillum magnetotacticum MS-1 TaxID=272627 RepID=A0A0C2UVC7_PARME|nr:ATP-binding protein [Paramagnetospirillum magnetotacticum]KIL96781.1 Phytochrome two-component sensor histidine kinase Cyanobacterial phytochrome B [Paramagnetospirillum magnetotacticum MS-1]